MIRSQTSDWYNPAVSQGLTSPNYCWGTNLRKPSGPAAIGCINRPDTWMQVTRDFPSSILHLPIRVRPYMGHEFTVVRHCMNNATWASVAKRAAPSDCRDKCGWPALAPCPVICFPAKHLGPAVL